MNKEMTSAKEQNPISDLNKDLLQGRFDATRAPFVELEDDKDTIYGKAFDFSHSTIHDLFQKGYEQAEDAYDRTIRNEQARAVGSREKT